MLLLPHAMVYQKPPLSMLDNKIGGEADRGDINQNAATIEQTLDSFGIKAQVKEVNLGPAVTQYASKFPAERKLSKITALQNDLALALSRPYRANSHRSSDSWPSDGWHRNPQS
jgi:DNA segregation ATPase FtsK/SpoIIIE, S-DNA-T family